MKKYGVEETSMKSLLAIIICLAFAVPCYADTANYEAQKLLSVEGTLWLSTNAQGEEIHLGFFGGQVWVVENSLAVAFQAARYKDFIVFSTFEFGEGDDRIKGIVVNFFGIGKSYQAEAGVNISKLTKISDNWQPEQSFNFS